MGDSYDDYCADMDDHDGKDALIAALRERADAAEANLAANQGKISRLEADLAEARAENERLRKTIAYFEETLTLREPIAIHEGVDTSCVSTEKVAHVVQERDALRELVGELAEALDGVKPWVGTGYGSQRVRRAMDAALAKTSHE